MDLCSVELRQKILGREPLFQNLSVAELEQINRLFKEIGNNAGDYFNMAGDPAKRLFVVAEGRVRLMRIKGEKEEKRNTARGNQAVDSLAA